MNKTIWSAKRNEGIEKDTILSILIPSTTERSELLNTLSENLKKQIIECDQNVEIIVFTDNKELSIGAKRNQLMEIARGEYVCYFDDDDMPSPNYIELILKAIESKPDCCSLKGIITWNGQNPEIFEHSIKYKEWRTATFSNPKYERPPNHLNVIKSSIAKRFKFPELNHGEDSEWSEAILKSGLIQIEAYIEQVIYNYLYISKK
jgi:glycosyltransferase involved in cell wall biosynthesis